MQTILAQPVPPPRFDARKLARTFYWKGWSLEAIAEELALKPATVRSWKMRDEWDKDPPIVRMETCLEARFNTLLDKEKKSGADFKEIDLLARQMERLARIRRYQEPDGHEGDLNDKVANRNAGERKKAKPNTFTTEQVEELERLLHESNFGYQETWWANIHRRTRFILKSRQIGATHYFAREALLDALKGGGNQVFLSASKRQAHAFRRYILIFAAQVGVDLRGKDQITVRSELMPPGEPFATFTFLGTNALTAQGESGNFYFDECFWVRGFAELNKVAAKGIASHKRWRRTYISTPSSVAHEAHGFWTGTDRNRGRKKVDQVTIDTSHAALKDGRLGEDGVWRHIVTLTDAEEQGCDLFDHDEIRAENSPEEYANLYGCQFVDDSQSAFKFNDLIACSVDSMVEWPDVQLDAATPYRGEVWAGYDPQESEDGDDAALVIAIPPKDGGPFRIIERHRLRGDFEQQAQFIEARLGRYARCAYLGIDKTGVGAGVYQLLRDRLRNTNVVAISYDLAVKAEMVMKAQHVVSRARLAFEAGWIDIVSAFMAIKRTITTSGRAVTFKAGRSKADSHADLAWAIMHILINEPLDGSQRSRTRMEIL